MTIVQDSGSLVAWQPWGAEAFASARAQRTRVLLWIGTGWTAGAREMARQSFEDEGVRRIIASHYVPVRVDADERPDLADRYELGALPTTVVLEADGALVGGGTYVPGARLASALERLAGSSHLPASPPAEPDLAATDDGQLLEMLRAGYDTEHGGWGGSPRFPHVAPVRLALRAGEVADLEWALRSLDAMGWGGLSDADGAFFRYCRGADWTSPQPEKLLTVNAALLDLFVEAAAAGHGEFLDRARAVLAFIERDLRRTDGTWRVAAGPRPGRVFTDANALTVSAMLRAAHLLGDATLAQRAIGTLEDLLLATYRPGLGLAHHGGGIRGLLTDHVAMAAACLDAWDAAGQQPHRMMAEELMLHALRGMWAADGGFLDRSRELAAGDPVRLELLKPFALNSDAAVVLHRIALAVDDREWGDRAREVLEVLSPLAAAQGPLAAHYLLARSTIGS